MWILLMIEISSNGFTTLLKASWNGGVNLTILLFNRISVVADLARCLSSGEIKVFTVLIGLALIENLRFGHVDILNMPSDHVVINMVPFDHFRV